MKHVATPVSLRSPSRSRRIWAWVVTSSEVVGSSATRRLGPQENPTAMSTPRSIPPEEAARFEDDRPENDPAGLWQKAQEGAKNGGLSRPGLAHQAENLPFPEG